MARWLLLVLLVGSVGWSATAPPPEERITVTSGVTTTYNSTRTYPTTRRSVRGFALAVQGKVFTVVGTTARVGDSTTTQLATVDGIQVNIVLTLQQGTTGGGGGGNPPPDMNDPFAMINPIADYNFAMNDVRTTPRNGSGAKDAQIQQVYQAGDRRMTSSRQQARAGAWAGIQRQAWNDGDGIKDIQLPPWNLTPKADVDADGRPVEPPMSEPAISSGAMVGNRNALVAWMRQSGDDLPKFYLQGAKDSIMPLCDSSVDVLIRNVQEIHGTDTATGQMWTDAIIHDRFYTARGSRVEHYQMARDMVIAAWSARLEASKNHYIKADYPTLVLSVATMLEQPPNRGTPEQQAAQRQLAQQRSRQRQDLLTGLDPRHITLLWDLHGAIRSIKQHADAWSAITQAVSPPDDFWITESDGNSDLDVGIMVKGLSSAQYLANLPPDNQSGIPIFDLGGAHMWGARTLRDLDYIPTLAPRTGEKALKLKASWDAVKLLKERVYKLHKEAADLVVPPGDAPEEQQGQSGQQQAQWTVQLQDPHLTRMSRAKTLAQDAQALLADIETAIDGVDTYALSTELPPLSIPAWARRDDGLASLESAIVASRRIMLAGAMVSQFCRELALTVENDLRAVWAQYGNDVILAFQSENPESSDFRMVDQRFRLRLRWQRGFAWQGMTAAGHLAAANELVTRLQQLAMTAQFMDMGSGSYKDGVAPEQVSALAQIEAQAIIILGEASIKYRMAGLLAGRHQASGRMDTMIPALEAARAAIGYHEKVGDRVVTPAAEKSDVEVPTPRRRLGRRQSPGGGDLPQGDGEVPNADEQDAPADWP